MGLTAEARRPQGRTYTGVDLVDCELHPLGPGLAAIHTARCPLADGPNEDSCAVLPVGDDAGLLVVADGAGGLPAGERASALAVAAIRSAVRRVVRDGTDLRLAVLDGIERAARDVAGLAIGAGTTIAVAEIQGRRLRTYHVGDSQILVVGSGGKQKLRTMSHSPTGYAVEAGLLGERDALHHEDRHLVLNLLGFEAMHMTLTPAVELAPRDTVLVASDGLFDNLHLDEIADACRKGQLLAVASTLAERARARMAQDVAGSPSKPDDLTILAYRRRVSS